jgi:copper oxidase (laccase) domain-containing protein
LLGASFGITASRLGNLGRLRYGFMPMTQAPYYLDELNREPGVRAAFVSRIAGVEVDTDREATVARLQPAHVLAVESMGFAWSQLHRAEQVHGSEIAIVKKSDPVQVWGGVDGLISADPGVLLGIYVADCGAVYLSDPVRGVVALLHSGKKGTEGNITGKAIDRMISSFGCDSHDITVVLAPCIRPPAYEVDFASQIYQQALQAGIKDAHFIDSGICTSSDLSSYYSYRVEKGSTGRMLALLGRVM